LPAGLARHLLNLPFKMSAATMVISDEHGTLPLPVEQQAPVEGEFYCLTIFTSRWREIRDFYVEILNARILKEVFGRFTELEIAGLPVCLRSSDHGETTSYFHLCIAMKNREPVLRELRRRGIIVTQVGPYVNFRDPEGRVIKLSEERRSAA
jgi:catechol 2,3-dioxygenase-like lactoylglutathione lyase family enzyme